MRNLPVLMLLAAAVGCGGSPAPKTAAKSQPAARGAAAAPQASAGVAERAASEVAKQFLSAVLKGDSQSAATLLTAKAAQRHAQDPSTLAALGLAVERLEVAQALMLDDDEAAVACLVTEPGATEPAELCCLLKRESAGWRVCGVASDSGGEEPAVISFEGDLEPSGDADPQFVTGPNAPAVERTATAPGAGPVR